MGASDAIKFDRNLSESTASTCIFRLRVQCPIQAENLREVDVEKAKPSLEAVEKHIKSLL